MGAKIDNRQANHQRAPRKNFVEQMRDVEEERLSAVHVGADFAEARQKFADNDKLIKARHPKTTRDYPNQKNSERREPRPPAAPRFRAFRFSKGELINNDTGKQERVDDRALDQHSGRQQTKHDPTIARRPSLLAPNFFPNQESDQKDDERERHIG